MVFFLLSSPSTSSRPAPQLDTRPSSQYTDSSTSNVHGSQTKKQLGTYFLATTEHTPFPPNKRRISFDIKTATKNDHGAAADSPEMPVRSTLPLSLYSLQTRASVNNGGQFQQLNVIVLSRRKEEEEARWCCILISQLLVQESIGRQAQLQTIATGQAQTSARLPSQSEAGRRDTERERERDLRRQPIERHKGNIRTRQPGGIESIRRLQYSSAHHHHLILSLSRRAVSRLFTGSTTSRKMRISKKLALSTATNAQCD